MAEQINNGGPAFPQHSVPVYQQRPELWGMSLRDYFAAAALQGLLANREFLLFTNDGDEMCATLAATNAYELADAMIAASERREPSAQ